MQIEFVQRTCDAEGCHKSMRVDKASPLTPAQLKEIGDWRSVSRETLSDGPEPVPQLTTKHFCSVDCAVNTLLASMANGTKVHSA